MRRPTKIHSAALAAVLLALPAPAQPPRPAPPDPQPLPDRTPPSEPQPATASIDPQTGLPPDRTPAIPAPQTTSAQTALASAVRAQPATNAADEAYVQGLRHLAAGKWADAADAFAQAVRADDENPRNHAHLGIALLLANDPAAAKTALDRALRLDPKNGDAIVWAYARRMMYEPTAFAGPPPYKKTPYAAKVIDNAINFGGQRPASVRDSALAAIHAATKDHALRQLGASGGTAVAAATVQQVNALFAEGKFAQCLATLEDLRAAGPIDAQMTAFAGLCKFELRDFAGARLDLTTALRAEPANPAWVLTRARALAAIGCVRDAESDFQLARALFAATGRAQWPAKHDDELKSARAAAESADPADLWQQLLAPDLPTDRLTTLAARLRSARDAVRYIREEEYTRRLIALTTAITLAPEEIAPQRDLAHFLLRPTTRRPVATPGNNRTAEVPVGAPDPLRAEPHLQRALTLQPGDGPTLALLAASRFQTNKKTESLDLTLKALAAGVLTLDLAELHLTLYTDLALQATAEAAALRSPTVRFEDRREGNLIVTYRYSTPPTPQALARADALDAKAAQYRAAAPVPINTLLKKIETADTPADRIATQLARAYLARSTADREAAITHARAALDIDPYNLDALGFLIAYAPRVGRTEIARECQNVLNTMAYRSALPPLLDAWPLIQQTKWKSARQAIQKAADTDPGSPHVANALLVLAAEQKDTPALLAAARIIRAMESARVATTGRDLAATTPLHADDAATTMFVLLRVAQNLDAAGEFDDALALSLAAVSLGERVPTRQRLLPALPDSLRPFAPGSIAPAINLTGPPARAPGTAPDNTVASLLTDAHKLAAYKLIAANRHREAVKHVAYLAAVKDSATTNIAYRIYQAAGFEPLRGQIDDGYQKIFQQMDHRRDIDRQNGRSNPADEQNAQIAEIDTRINQINREIARGTGREEQAALEAERQELLNRRAKLQQSPRRRGS